MKRQWFAFLLLGLLIGATSCMVYVRNDLSQLQSDLSALRQANDQLENENQFLVAEATHPAPVTTIKSIKIDCPENVDLIVQSAIKKQVLKSLSFLLGKSQQIVLETPHLPAYVVNPQSIVIDKRKFRLRVTLVIIAHDTLTIDVVGQPQI